MPVSGSNVINDPNSGNAAGVDIAGSLPIVINPSAKNLYTAVTANFIPPATATDMVVITGSATKLIRILYIYFSAVQTTTAIGQFFISKRSTDDAGGTSVGVAVIPHDSASPVNTAVIRQYSANPTTLGTLVGGISMHRPKILVPGTNVQPLYLWDFINNGQTKGIVLRGISEVLAVANNGNAIPAGFGCNVEIIFAEE